MPSKQRFGIRMTATGEVKSVKISNVFAHGSVASVPEACYLCKDAYYPNDFPPCSCMHSAHMPTQVSNSCSTSLEKETNHTQSPRLDGALKTARDAGVGGDAIAGVTVGASDG